MLRWLIGASLAWLLFDLVYYGNTISSPVIVKLVSPHASLTGQTAIVLAIFAVAALPGFILAAFTIDKIGRKLLQSVGFAVMAVAFACLWLVPGATTTLVPFMLLFGATYYFYEFGPNTTTFVYPAEISRSGSGRRLGVGLLATLALLPEPKGASLEDLTEDRYPTSAVALGLAESRGTRVHST
jgi:MFS transporter, PHS family, inorganic phosphate transporter